MRASIEPHLKFLIAIILSIFFLAGVGYYVYFEEKGMVGQTSQELEKIGYYGCTSDKDCAEGICVNARCVCFVDEHCSNYCFMPTGECR